MSNQDFGYGHMTPYDTTDMWNVIAFAVRQLVAKISTNVLVQVQAVHAGDGTPPVAGTVDVLPLVSLLDGNGNPTKQGIVPGLPWFRLQSGLGAVICDPVVGDTGYVAVSSRDISKLKAAGPGQAVQSNPGSGRQYDLADGVYVGGCLMVAPTQYVQFTSDGITIADKNGNKMIWSSSGIKVIGKLEVTELVTDDDGLTVTGTIKATSNIIAGFGGLDQVGLQTHEHPTAGTGAPSPPTPGT